ncbi:MAG TPA: alpha/beta hydrolase [Paludibaculum sp.]|jgi:esterase/lipase superfamily enzyme
MIIVSCRRGFDSNALLASENHYRNYTNPNSNATFKDLNLTDVLTAATNKHVCIFVHGFNNPMENVLPAYWEMVQNMKDSGLTGPSGYGLVIGFAWPGVQTGIGYFPALAAAKKSAPFLIALINSLRAVAHTVDVETHSLGARVALVALANPKKVFVDNLLLTAPAVDNHTLEPDQAFHPSLDSCNRCFVYHSGNDPVLKVAFPLADITDGIHKALGLKGPRSRTVTLQQCLNTYVVDCTARVDSHGGYRKIPQFYAQWNQLLSGSAMSRYDELS